MENKKWNHMHSAGGKFNEIPGVLADEVIVAVGSEVKIYGNSGLVIAKMQTSQYIVGMISLAERQIITVGEAGKICLWNSTELTKSFDLGLCVVQAVGNQNHKKGIFIINSSDGYYELRRLNLKTGAVKLFKKYKRAPSCMQLSADGNYLVVGDGKRLEVLSFKDGFSKQSFSTPEHITSVDIHPIENYIAVGDSLGKITFWYFMNKPKPLTSTVHWHANKVNCVKFTQDGVYLLSGGHEGVLVIWQLETRAKHFLPHLGSEIRNISISADQLSYLLHLKENSLKIVSAVDLQVKNVLNGTKTTNTDKNYPFSTGIILDPRSRSAVMNGYPGTIQFYDVMNDSHVLDLEITPRNRISSSEDFEIVVPHITKVAFSQNGNWMATIDKKVDSVFGIERYLHFWKFDHETQTYVAHTRIESPHDQDITSIDFRPSKDGNMLLVTSGLDKKFKIWELAKASTMNDEESWTCLYSSSYKDMAANCAKFSPDGSILCVCFGKMITLWDPLTLTLEKVLYYSVSKGSDLKHISFSNNFTHLIAGSKTHIYVWNLLSCSVEWCLPFKALRIVSESGSDRFLALSKQSQVLVFSVTSPIPVFYQDLNANNCSIVDATFINSNTKSTILLLTSNHQFDIIMESPPIDAQQNTAQILKSSSSRLFTDIFGNSIDRVSKDQKAVVSTHSAEKDVSFLSSPSFMTPPPVKLVQIFLESFLLPQVQLTNDHLNQNGVQLDSELIETPLVLKDDQSKVDHIMEEVRQDSMDEVSLDRMDALTELFRTSKIDTAHHGKSNMVQGKKKSRKSKK